MNVMNNNIELHPSLKSRMIELLTSPIQLFIELYQILEPQFGTLSNEIYTDLISKLRFNDLSDFFLTYLKKIQETPGLNEKPLNEIIKTIKNQNDTNLLFLSLFKGVTDYLVMYKKGTLKLLNPIIIKNYIITVKPSNPIYNALPNAVREYYGTGVHDLTDIFKYISVIKVTEPNVRFVKNEKLKYTCNYLNQRIKKGIKIAVTPFMNHIDFEFDSNIANWPSNEKTPYWFKKIKNLKEAKIWLLEKILKPCIEKKVDILTLPELSMDDRLLLFLREWLSSTNRKRVSSGKPGLLLVVAGSFRYERNNKHGNAAVILNHAGDILWTQNKMKRFSFDKTDIQKQPELQTLLKTSTAGGYECIDESDSLFFADTPLGRISVCICVDFFHPDHYETFRQAKINVFLVPAMTPQNIRFLKTADKLVSDNLASSFISNNGYAAKKEKNMIQKEGASFYFLPQKREACVFASHENTLLIFDMEELIKS